ncbi:MAG: M6 family metalloprotease domain-containing protein [Paludibacteraceae bacterium]|nr:M6 family metalloprotease domain-containing protein [Paludibacteraceae bacterium]
MKRITNTILLSILSINLCLAIPAKPGARLVYQPNGDSLTVFAHGDHHFSWLTDVDGNRVEQQPDGSYKVVPPLTAEEIEQRINTSPILQCRQRHAPAAAQREVPLNIAPRGLVILASFSNRTFTTSIDEMNEMLNGDNYTRDYSYRAYGSYIRITSSGSARQYFREQSMGQYEPQFDIVGPVTLSHPYNYYGQNYNNVDGQDTYGSDMIVEACSLANAQGVDFTQYDNNGDGYVDFVYVFYAGYGEADGGGANTVWPHSADLTGYYDNRFDGKLLSKYACSNEISHISNMHDGIGTLCHEFSHVLGLPDFYATNYAGHKTLGQWDIMDAGPYNNDGNTPPAYSAYERFFMGWLTPEVLNKPRTIRLADLKTSNTAYMVTASGESNLIGNDPAPAEFYLIENRQDEGWDKYIPGHGMLITKISYSYMRWMQNSVNNSARTMGVDIMEADGKAPNDNYGKASDAFPTGAEEYTPYEEYPITNITESNKIITFDFMGGGGLERAILNWVTDSIVNKKHIEYNTIEAVYDLSGHLLLSSGSEGTAIEELQMSPGTYVVKISNGETDKKKRHVKGQQVVIKN